MNAFASFVSSFCVSTVAIGLLYILSPEKYGNILKFLFGLIFILSIISSFAHIKDISLPELDENSISEAGDDLSVAKARLVFENALGLSKINFKKIEVCTTKSEDESIIITKVIIYSSEKKEKILNALGYSAKNYEVEIIDE